MSQVNEITDKSVFTTNIELNNVIEDDTSLCICGFVEWFDNIRDFVNTTNGKIFQFILNNGEGSTMQIVAWNEIAEKYSKKFNQSGMVLALEKVRPKIPKKPQYLKTTCKFEFHLQLCTKLDILGHYKEEKHVQAEVKIYKEFTLIRESIGRIIGVEAYLTPFREVITLKKATFISATVTDRHFKLQLVTRTDDNSKQILKDSNNVKGKPSGNP